MSFVKADAAVKQRLIWAGFGEAGSGKTSFALSAPGPIFVQSLDMGLEGVIESFQQDKDIYVAEYLWAPTTDLTQDAAIELRDQFIEDYEGALQKARTVVWDKETQIWELFRYAEFGPNAVGVANGAPRDYPKLYQRYRKYINMPKSLDVNFGVLQGMRSPWIAKVNSSTGKESLAKSNDRERKGMDEIDELVHINLHHEVVDGEFVVHTGKLRGPGARDVQYQTLPAMTFPELAQLVFPESSAADWE
jgi:hypothetical protein